MHWIGQHARAVGGSEAQQRRELGLEETALDPAFMCFYSSTVDSRSASREWRRSCWHWTVIINQPWRLPARAIGMRSSESNPHLNGPHPRATGRQDTLRASARFATHPILHHPDNKQCASSQPWLRLLEGRQKPLHHEFHGRATAAHGLGQHRSHGRGLACWRCRGRCGWDAVGAGDAGYPGWANLRALITLETGARGRRLGHSINQSVMMACPGCQAPGSQ